MHTDPGMSCQVRTGYETILALNTSCKSGAPKPRLGLIIFWKVATLRVMVY